MLNDAPISWWPYVPLLIYTRILQKNQTEELNPLWKYTVISMSQCVGREGKGKENVLLVNLIFNALQFKKYSVWRCQDLGSCKIWRQSQTTNQAKQDPYFSPAHTLLLSLACRQIIPMPTIYCTLHMYPALSHGLHTPELNQPSQLGAILIPIYRWGKRKKRVK